MTLKTRGLQKSSIRWRWKKPAFYNRQQTSMVLNIAKSCLDQSGMMDHQMVLFFDQPLLPNLCILWGSSHEFFIKLLPSFHNMYTLVFLINVLHVYLFLREFSIQHALIRNNTFISFQEIFPQTCWFSLISLKEVGKLGFYQFYESISC